MEKLSNCLTQRISFCTYVLYFNNTIYSLGGVNTIIAYSCEYWGYNNIKISRYNNTMVSPQYDVYWIFKKKKDK